MTKYEIHAAQRCRMECHFIWEVEATSKEEAKAKFAQLEEDGDLPYKSLTWRAVGTDADGIECIDRWEDEIDHDDLEVLNEDEEVEETA
jgi:hypothetical protein